MSDEDKFKGTGDLIGQIGPVKVYDDGDNDAFIRREIEYKGTQYSSLKHLRRELGDAELENALNGGGQTVSSDDFEIREPVAFKCDRCNQTYPRTMKAREGVCTDCE